jgi:cupin fold WbuC family metalloprotein
MTDSQIPELSEHEITHGVSQAKCSSRSRYPKLLHNQGDEFNRVFNFMMLDSYMQPHLHPGKEKVEKIYLVRGKVSVFFFDNEGAIRECISLEQGGVKSIEVPAFTWHTYTILSDYAITYETMNGVYKPETWKHFASWAPQEGSSESSEYLNLLKLRSPSGAL